MEPGRLLWTAAVGYNTSPPAIGNDGTIYFASSDGCLYAFDNTGEELWKSCIAGEFDEPVAIGDEGHLYLGSDDGVLYAFDGNGGKLWETELASWISTGVAIDRNGQLYVGTGSALVALDSSGRILWDAGVNNGTNDPVVGLDGNVYFVDYGSVSSRIDAKIYSYTSSGRERWSRSLLECSYSEPVFISDSIMLVGTLSEGLEEVNINGDIYSFVDYRDFYTDNVVARSGDSVYVMFTDFDNAVLRAYNLVSNSYEPKWEIGFTGKPSRMVMNQAGQLLVGGEDGVLYCLEDDGTTAWSFDTGTQFPLGIPNIGPDGTIYVYSLGNLYAISGNSPLARDYWPKPRGDMRNTGRQGSEL